MDPELNEPGQSSSGTHAGHNDRPSILIIGSGVMGSRVAAWLLLLGERVRIWTTTGRKYSTKQAAIAKSFEDVRQAMESSTEDRDFSMSAAMAAKCVAADDSDLFAALPFVITDGRVRVNADVWDRLSVEANDGRPGRTDNRSAVGVWLVIDCTRDPETDAERAIAIEKTAGLFVKVNAQSPEAVLAIKHEQIDPNQVEAACGLPVIRLRFLKPVFFMPIVELQGINQTVTSRVVKWLEGLHLMPFTSAGRVRMMHGSTVDDRALRLMRKYAQKHYKGITQDNDVCCVCFDENNAVVLCKACGKRIFCNACSLDYWQRGMVGCPLCREPLCKDSAVHVGLTTPMAQSAGQSPDPGFGVASPTPARPNLEEQLLQAAQDGDVAQVRYLLNEGANVNARSRRNATPLIVAAMRGSREIVNILLDAGASIDLVTSAGNTAVLVAAMQGHDAVTSLLLRRGADASLRNLEGFSLSDHPDLVHRLRGVLH